MKKKFLLAFIMLSAIMMVGCVDADVTVDLEKDGTGKAIIQVLGPKTVFDNIPEENINELGKDFETVEKIADSDKSGYRFATRQGKLEEIFKEITNIDASLQENQDSQDNSGDVENQNSNSSVNAETVYTESNNNDLANELYEKYVDINEEQSLI